MFADSGTSNIVGEVIILINVGHDFLPRNLSARLLSEPLNSRI